MDKRTSADPQGELMETIELSFHLPMTTFELRKLILAMIQFATSWADKPDD